MKQPSPLYCMYIPQTCTPQEHSVVHEVDEKVAEKIEYIGKSG